MKKFAFVIAVIGAATLTACDSSEQKSEAVAEEEQTLNLESLDAKVSYLLGFRSIEQPKGQGVDIDLAVFTAGANAAFEDSESAITREDAQAAFTEYQAHIQSKAQVEFENVAAENLAKSEAFLAENAAKDGVVTTESGLQYKVLETGEGEMPTIESTVQVHYEGRSISGEVFDSSIARGTPVEFALTQVIAGWTEGLQLMPEGSKYEFTIPGDIAYGPGGSRSIGPNEALIFVVALIQANYVAESE